MLALQVTDGSNMSKRVQKIKEECAENAVAWLRCGGVIEVWGWRRVKNKATKRLVMSPRIVQLTLDDIDEQRS